MNRCLARTRAVTAICLLFVSLYAHGGDELKFAVVSGVETFHRSRSDQNLYPWEKAEPGEIIVSNACGFAEVEYWKVTAPAFKTFDDEQSLKHWKAFVLLGEWCRIQEFILEGPTLVAYRDWKGKHYVVGFADLQVAQDRRLFFDDPNFMQVAGLAQLQEGEEGRVYLSTLRIRPDGSRGQ